MKDLFSKIQKAALPGIWSKGVKIAQAKGVRLDQRSDQELVFRILAPGTLLASLTVLYLEDFEWTCDCDTNFDPCEHVIAAAIRAKEASFDDPETEPEHAPHLAYRLTRGDNITLTLERVIRSSDGADLPLAEPLSRMLARRACPVTPTHDDLEVEKILLPTGSGNTRAYRSKGLSKEGYAKLLIALAAAKEVTLDGAPVQVNLTPLTPRAEISDIRAPGTDKKSAAQLMCLRVQKDKPVEVLDRGLGLLHDTLHPLGATDIAGQRWERLPLVKNIQPEEVAELVTRVLPELERELDLQIRSRLLPGRGSDAPPRIHFDFSPHGHTLSVLPTLVYGDPPQIRIDADKVIHLSGDIPRRNPTKEHKLVQQLKDELSLVPGRLSHYDGLDAGRFAKRLQQFQTHAGSSLPGHVIAESPLTARLRLDGSSFQVEFETDDPTPRKASLDSVFQAYSDGLEMVPLLDGGWASLPLDFLSRHGDRILEVLAARNERGNVPLYATQNLSDLCQELDLPEPREFQILKRLADDFEGIPQVSLPAALTVPLRSYQEQGVRWLSFLQTHGLGAVLADDMGLGKTLQALTVAHGRVLVVCPKSVVFNWAQETARFRPDLTVNIYHGPNRKLTDADVTLTTFSVLRMDEVALTAVSWDLVILDEAQAIKNPESQLARSAFALSDKLGASAQRVALSGTPIENRLDELWSVFRFTHPGLLGSRRDFQKRYALPIQAGDAECGARLKRVIKPFLLRRLKKDVLTDLPPRTNVVLTVELDPDERELYQAIFAAKQREVIEALENGQSIMLALEALLRLRQAACHPSLIPGQSRERSSKVDALLEALEDATAGGHKSIVFSQWTSLLDLVAPELESRDIAFVRLDGSTEDRQGVVSRFQDPAGPPVFLSSLKAGGTGLNLTAADYVFLLDPWWNPAAEDQAADRAHRIGQKRAVTVYRLIAKDTIEEGILALQSAKRALSDSVLDEGGAGAGLTRENLLALLRG